MKLLERLYRRIFPKGYKYPLSSIIVWISGTRRKSNKILRKLKNKYEGQRCFVIGNGPSLTKSDVELLKGEITFASNRIFKMFSETEWRPTYYAIFDEVVASDKDVAEKVNTFTCDAKFFRAQAWTITRGYENGCYLHSWYNRKYLDNPQFSTDLTKGIYTIATVTYTLIQIARYMGFSEIYLLGVDHKYANELKRDGTVEIHQIPSYFGNMSTEETNVLAASWEMERAYEFAERYSKDNGFRIYNATRGGYLEVFERVNLDSLFERKGEII